MEKEQQTSESMFKHFHADRPEGIIFNISFDMIESDNNTNNSVSHSADIHFFMSLTFH